MLYGEHEVYILWYDRLPHIKITHLVSNECLITQFLLHLVIYDLECKKLYHKRCVYIVNHECNEVLCTQIHTTIYVANATKVCKTSHIMMLCCINYYYKGMNDCRFNTMLMIDEVCIQNELLFETFVLDQTTKM